MRLLPKAAAYTFTFKMVLATDGHTVATGKTVAITISKAGGAFGNLNAGATNATEISAGIYKVALDSTDTNTEGDLIVRGTATACDDLLEICQVGSPVKLDDAVSHGGTPGSSTATLAVSRASFSSASGNPALVIENTGAGDAMDIVAAASNAINIAATNADVIRIQSTGDAAGLYVQGSGTEPAFYLVATGTGSSLELETAAGDAITVSPVDGHGINITANGTSKHGILVTGGTAGTSDGVKVVAGTGGVAFRQDILQQALTEAYAADGAAFTAAQALYEICQLVSEFSISGTTITVKKRDGSTTAMTFTLDDATSPTARTRAT